MREEGWRVNHKQIERLWRQEWLEVPKKQRKRLWLADGSCGRLHLAVASDGPLRGLAPLIASPCPSRQCC